MRQAQRRDQRGQALIEFTFAILVFMMAFIGLLDLAQGVFAFNGVSQAAREIARETSVHPGTGSLGASAESIAMVSNQRGLVPRLQTPVYQCVDIAGASVADACQAGDWVRVTATTVFQPALPLLAMLGPFTLTSTSSAEIQ
jgi:Flp pilus assembly protein TadG